MLDKNNACLVSYWTYLTLMYALFSCCVKWRHLLHIGRELNVYRWMVGWRWRGCERTVRWRNLKLCSLKTTPNCKAWRNCMLPMYDAVQLGMSAWKNLQAHSILNIQIQVNKHHKCSVALFLKQSKKPKEKRSCSPDLCVTVVKSFHYNVRKWYCWKTDRKKRNVTACIGRPCLGSKRTQMQTLRIKL